MKYEVTSFIYVLKRNCMRSVLCNGLCVCVYESSFISGYSIANISKIHGVNMGPPGAYRTQVGPMLAPWTLFLRIILYTKINFVMDPFLMQFHYFYSTVAYHDKHHYCYIQLIKYCDEISFSVLKSFFENYMIEI